MRKINWDKQIKYAQKALDRNKAQIDSTYKGTAANKADTWSIKPRRSKGRMQ